MQPTNFMHIIHNVLNTLLRAVLAIFLSVPIAGIIAAGLVEGVSALITRQFPTTTTHLLAAAFGIVVGYASAVTFAVIESVRGGVHLARMLESDFSHETTILDKAIKGFEQRVTGRH